MMSVEELVRQLAPRVLGRLVRRHGQFHACEDAVQEALLRAVQQWPTEGVPDRPEAWLHTVASRRLVDRFRSEGARRRREDEAILAEPDRHRVPGPGETPPVGDDTLTLLYLCCHPALTPTSQVALTLRAAGGLTTAEIARAFLVPEDTMTRRISRAKDQIRDQGASFAAPPADEFTERLRVVLHVLYLIFNEGYVATSGPDAMRVDLTDEAIRLTRTVRRLLPDQGEVAGLLALMLLTDARRPARIDVDGNLVPLAEQDRTRWDRQLVDEGTALVTESLTAGPLGTYQLQAAIAAVHAEAARAQDTDWNQILALYNLLDRMTPGPVVSLNRAVALAKVKGPEAGLDLLETMTGKKRLTGHHRLAAVRGHLHELAGDPSSALTSYQEAARLTTSLLERRYLEAQVTRLTSSSGSSPRPEVITTLSPNSRP